MEAKIIMLETTDSNIVLRNDKLYTINQLNTLQQHAKQPDDKLVDFYLIDPNAEIKELP